MRSSYNRGVGQFRRESVGKTIEKCIPHNVITKLVCQRPKRKQQSGVSTSKRWRKIRDTLCDSSATRVGELHKENEGERTLQLGRI